MVSSGGMRKKFTEALQAGSGIIACYEELFDASRIALFGFDAVSRRCGLVETVEAICSIDSEVSKNPIGEIYERLEPDAEKRRELVMDAAQISLDSCEYPYDVKVGTMPKITVNADGEVREKGVAEMSSRSHWRSRGEAPEIIASFKRFVDGLEKDETYSELIDEAEAKNISAVALLATGARTPSLSRMFLKLEAELSTQAKITMRTLRTDGVNIAERADKIHQMIEDKHEEELEKYADIKQTLDIKLGDTQFGEMREILSDSIEKTARLIEKRRKEIDDEIESETSKYLKSVDCSEGMLKWIDANKKHLDKIIDDLDYIAKRR